VIFGLPLLFIRPVLIIYYLVFITFLPYSWNPKLSVGPVNIYLSDGVLVVWGLVLIVSIFNHLLRRKNINELIPSGLSPVWIILLYLFMHMTFMVLAYINGVALDAIVRRFIVYSGCIFFFFPLCFSKEKVGYRRLLLFLIVIVLVYPIYQIYAYLVIGHYGLTSSGTARLDGSGGTYTIAAALFAILIWKRGPSKYVLSILPILSLILIGHRSGLVALIIGLTMLFILRKEFVKGAAYLYGLTLSLLLFLVGLDYFLGTQFLYEGTTRAGDTFNAADKNVVGRAYAIVGNFQVFLSKPILGIGYNYEDLAKSFNVSIHPHNFIMRFLSHTGLVGTTLIISFIVLIYKKAWAVFKYSSSMKDFGIFVLCSITFFLIFSLMNTTFFTTGASLFWFLSGLIVTVPEISEGSQNRSPKRPIKEADT
jgi:O-antigen ligase